MSDTFKCQYCDAQLPAFVADSRCPECGSSIDLLDNNPENSLIDGNAVELDPADKSSFAHRLRERRSKPAEISERDFGAYRLIDILAEGPMGQVYKAKHTQTGDLFALKIIHPQHLQTDLEVDRFEIEAAACKALDHPAIVPVVDFGIVGEQRFVVMKYVDGLNLAEVIEEEVFSSENAAQLMEQIAEAVRFAHERGVIHRNLKPSNILLDAARNPHLCDFGMAQQTDRQIAFNRGDASSDALVSIFVAPEQLACDWSDDEAQVERASVDIYSLGAILYAMLTGKAPHGDGLVASKSELNRLLPQIVSQEPAPIVADRPEVNRDLQSICMCCLEKDPNERYQSAQQLMDDLARFNEKEPVLAKPVTLVRRLQRWKRLILDSADLRLRSSQTLFGLPMVDVAFGRDTAASLVAPDFSDSVVDSVIDEIQDESMTLKSESTNEAELSEQGHAKGIVAFGDQAIGIVAVGKKAIGVIAIGKRAFGLLAIGWLAIGLISAGAAAFGVYALGGICLGYRAAGVVALGYAVWGVISVGWLASGWWSWGWASETTDAFMDDGLPNL